MLLNIPAFVLTHKTPTYISLHSNGFSETHEDIFLPVVLIGCTQTQQVLAAVKLYNGSIECLDTGDSVDYNSYQAAGLGSLRHYGFETVTQLITYVDPDMSEIQGLLKGLLTSSTPNKLCSRKQPTTEPSNKVYVPDYLRWVP